MVQGNNTHDFNDIVDKIHLLGWNEVKKLVKCWVEKKRKKVFNDDQSATGAMPGVSSYELRMDFCVRHCDELVKAAR